MTENSGRAYWAIHSLKHVTSTLIDADPVAEAAEEIRAKCMIESRLSPAVVAWLGVLQPIPFRLFLKNRIIEMICYSPAIYIEVSEQALRVLDRSSRAYVVKVRQSAIRLSRCDKIGL